MPTKHIRFAALFFRFITNWAQGIEKHSAKKLSKLLLANVRSRFVIKCHWTA